MNIDGAFPSKYLKASDLDSLPGKRVQLSIRSITVEDITDDEEKPVMYFDRGKKGLVINRTIAEELKLAFGPMTEAWIGKPVEIYATTTPFRGKVVPCVRVRVLYPAAGTPADSFGPAPQPSTMAGPAVQGPGEAAAAKAKTPFDDSTVLPGDAVPF